MSDEAGQEEAQNFDEGGCLSGADEEHDRGAPSKEEAAPAPLSAAETETLRQVAVAALNVPYVLGLCRSMQAARQLYSVSRGALEVALQKAQVPKPELVEEILCRWVRTEAEAKKDGLAVLHNLLTTALPWLAEETLATKDET